MLAELRQQIPQALEIVRTYRRYLHDGHTTVEELVITKSLSKEPQAYRQQTLSMIAAQELLARGVPLQAGTRFTTLSRLLMRLVLPTVYGRWPDSMGPGAAMSRPMTTCL